MGDFGMECVCDFTGGLLTKETPQPIMCGGSKKVIYSNPFKEDSHTIVMGINQENYKST